MRILKLSIPKYQVSKEKAEKYILALCKKLNIQMSNKKGLRCSISISNGSNKTEVNFPEEIAAVRKTGKALKLQNMVDSNDKFLNTPVSLAVLGSVSGLSFDLRSSYGSHTTKVGFPGCIEAPEISFSEDIDFYRKEAVRFFNGDDYQQFARAYRGCLQSCISLVDCFIHRYTFHVKEMIPSTKEYKNTAILDSRSSIEDRLNAWITTFAAHKIDEYSASKNRHMFFELKKERNKIVHAAYPSVGYGVRDIVRHLNNVPHGVGGFLSELRGYTGFTENIGFIQQIRTLAKIRILNNT